MNKEKHFEYRDGSYYLRIPNDKIISKENWDKILKLIKELKKEQNE